MDKFACPCCGYETLDEEPPGTYDICEICFWEDDGVQYKDPDYRGGANHVSLREAQRNFSEYGACEERCLEHVRKPTESDKYLGPKDITMIQRMPIHEMINIFNAVNAPMEKILDIYKGYIKINNSNFVFNSSQLFDYIDIDESFEYSMLKDRDNPNVKYGNSKVYEMTEKEVNKRIDEIQKKFIAAVRTKQGSN
jgi:hypothetical protein